MTCIPVTLEVGATTVIFDGETPDADGNVWLWSALPGWWDPPALEHSSVVLGGDLGELVTNSVYRPREVTVEITCDVRGGSLGAARDTMTALANMLVTPGTLTVDDGDPRYATVLLESTFTHSLIADVGLQFNLPLVAFDAYRHLVSDDSGSI